jgi:hypothetical protein
MPVKAKEAKNPLTPKGETLKLPTQYLQLSELRSRVFIFSSFDQSYS